MPYSPRGNAADPGKANDIQAGADVLPVSAVEDVTRDAAAATPPDDESNLSQQLRPPLPRYRGSAE